MDKHMNDGCEISCAREQLDDLYYNRNASIEVGEVKFGLVRT